MQGVVLQTPQLIDCKIMKVELAIQQNVGNLQNIKSIFLFHRLMLFQMCPIGANTTYKQPNL